MSIRDNGLFLSIIQDKIIFMLYMTEQTKRMKGVMQATASIEQKRFGREIRSNHGLDPRRNLH